MNANLFFQFEIIIRSNDLCLQFLIIVQENNEGLNVITIMKKIFRRQVSETVNDFILALPYE